jgi:hypothetical protein
MSEEEKGVGVGYKASKIEGRHAHTPHEEAAIRRSEQSHGRHSNSAYGPHSPSDTHC